MQSMYAEQNIIEKTILEPILKPCKLQVLRTLAQHHEAWSEAPYP